MELIDTLLKSTEPSIRFKTRVYILNENSDSSANKKLREEIRTSPRVQRLLSYKDESGMLEPVRSPYHKWFGAHRCLFILLSFVILKEIKLYSHCASQQGNTLYSCSL